MFRDPLAELLFPELSYRIVGILFQVHNTLPNGYQEKHVQRATAIALTQAGIKFAEQVATNIEFGGTTIGRYFFDFVVEDKIVVELKVGERLTRKDFDQVKHYLQRSGLRLGLLVRFGQKGVKVYRILKPR